VTIPAPRRIRRPAWLPAAAFWIICGGMLVVAASLIAFFRLKRWL